LALPAKDVAEKQWQDFLPQSTLERAYQACCANSREAGGLLLLIAQQGLPAAPTSRAVYNLLAHHDTDCLSDGTAGYRHSDL